MIKQWQIDKLENLDGWIDFYLNKNQSELTRLANDKKQQILEMARNGEDRPNQRTHPLGDRLCSYTNPKSECYDPEFDKEIKQLRPDWFITQSDGANDKKQQILQMARNGEDRPSKNHGDYILLGRALCSYTNKNNKCYDAEFDKEIRKITPSWFISQSDRANWNKEILLKMAQKGEPRPQQKKHHLATCLGEYLNKKSKSYDMHFYEQLKKIAPDWLINQSDKANEKKKKLLEMARQGISKPLKNDLWESFKCYTTKSQKGYDPVFDKEIRQLRPDWFITQSDIANDKKQLLLEMAKNGEPKPVGKKNSLAIALMTYICVTGNYDAEFHEKLKKMAPEWLISRSDKANEKKKKLLEMARLGEPRPNNLKTRIGQALGCYIGKNHKSYDAEFDKKIRKVAPHWFIDTAVETKKQLLEMAKNGEPKPSYCGTKIGMRMYAYITNTLSYDPIFDKEIRKLRPDWFINTAIENKKLLLEMARNNEDRPSVKKHLLGSSLCSYTNSNSSSYDPIFDKQIRELRPDWFITQFDKTNEKKQQLLEMAKNSEDRPTKRRHLLGERLCSYVNSKSNCYDPEFDKQIRQLRPDWFKR